MAAEVAMYVNPRTRQEFGVEWRQARNRKGQLCWKSPKRLNLTLVHSLNWVGSPIDRWEYGWCAYEGTRAFFTTHNLRRGFQVAARHGLREGRRQKHT